MEKKKKNTPKNNGKHPGGRPPKYTPEIIASLGQEMLQWFTDNKKSFWLKDFAIKKGFPSEYFSRFAEQNDEFRHAYIICKDIQESRLVHKGFKPYQDRFTTFVLKNVSGWRDNQTVQLDETQFEILIGRTNSQNKNT